jgi:hypothetical protein
MSPQECSQRAAECVALAGKVSDPANKLQLLIIARAWMKLANRSTRNLVAAPLCNTDASPDDGTSDPSPTAA